MAIKISGVDVIDDTRNISNIQTINPNFIIRRQGGNEGGEFYLQQAELNSTLAGNVTFDTFQNLLRIFENGGAYRGVYLDLAAQGSQSRILTEIDSRVWAWVTFNGYFGASPVILNGKNISSVTRISEGVYDIVLSLNMPNANYAVALSVQAQSTADGITAAVASSVAPTANFVRLQVSGYGYPARTSSAYITGSPRITAAFIW